MTWCREMKYCGMNGHATSYKLNVPNWGESFVWHPAVATTRDSSFSLSLSFTLSSNPLFFPSTLVIAPRTIGARRSQWLAGINDGQPSPLPLLVCISVFHPRDDYWYSDAMKYANWQEFAHTSFLHIIVNV